MALSVLLLTRSVPTERIARRRPHLTRDYTTDPPESFFAEEVMTDGPTLLSTRDLVTDVLPGTRHGILYPVVHDTGRPVGVTSRRALLGAGGRTVAAATTAPVRLAHPDDTLRDVRTSWPPGTSPGRPWSTDPSRPGSPA